jgi:hypothetical protein
MRNVLILFLASASLVFVSGCATSEAGGTMAGTAVYSKGELSDALAVSLMDAHVATLAGARDLQLTILNDEKSFAHANITASTAADTRFDITLVKQSQSLTQIRIRVGAAGDEQLSRELLEKIKAHL